MKTSISTALVSFLVLTGCQAAPLTAPADQTTAFAEQTALTPSAPLPADSVLADIGGGLKTPAAISVHLKLADLNPYKLQASSAGTAAKTLADLTHIRFYMIPSDTGTPPTALSGSGFTYAITGTNRTNGFVDVTFTNVAANATGKSYYIAAAGFASATTTAANNITNLNAPINDGTEGKYFCSTSGGSPAGGVRVTPTTYAISGTSALGVPLQLLDAVSPVIESSVNLTVGDEVTGSPSGSAN